MQQGSFYIDPETGIVAVSLLQCIELSSLTRMILSVHGYVPMKRSDIEYGQRDAVQRIALATRQPIFVQAESAPPTPWLLTRSLYAVIPGDPETDCLTSQAAYWKDVEKYFPRHLLLLQRKF